MWAKTVEITYIDGEHESVDVTSYTISENILILYKSRTTKCIPLSNIKYWEILK